ncbi:MAG: hypothetical protein JNG86_12215, partial [Verrucomicrobiaceae bacterium]|nr:hypothetical protein [Verrucomicrobiaceae bacterium]
MIVPYDAKKPLNAQQQPQRYYLGYDEFQRLWNLAKENRRPERVKDDEAALVVHEALYEARIEENGLVLHARLTAASRGTWTKLALPFGRVREGAADEKALVGEIDLDGRAAALTDGILTLEKPGVHRIALTATLPLSRDWQEVRLRLPPAMAGALALHTPRSDGWPRLNDADALTVTEQA